MMDRVQIDGVELEWQSSGSGEPVLLIGNGPIRDSFAVLESEPVLARGYRLIRYRQRGQSDGHRLDGPVSFSQHAADAAALADRLGITRLHAVGHSSGAAIALQLALDHPHLVQTLALLEPPLTSAAGAEEFFAGAGPALAAYAAGESAEAMILFLTHVSGLGREASLEVLEQRVPGSAQRALDDADVFFGGYLAALGEWRFAAEEGARIRQPVLVALGTRSHPWFVGSGQLLRSWVPQPEECVVRDAGHLLHLEQPAAVAQCVSEFLARHAISAPERLVERT